MPALRKDPVTHRNVHNNPIPQELLDQAALELADQTLPELPDELAEWDPDAPEDPGDEDPYPDWNEVTTRVVSGPIGRTKYPGMRHETWQAARAHARKYAAERKVKLYKFWTVPGRWFARVGRTA